ncbi:ankyrin repeat protein, putative [Bodo saltans]|uniref:Ankyrin repeat protein, putative n=1 Tax=Bodo saltans TaxID=75058 RepID=A0A0S4IMW9_BODSA|nr:ankyrin repeat protein, putative [Bodo saltans]|eukprot:CUE76029.1 ankyrin repeat protein, putative [Bodo saltans]
MSDDALNRTMAFISPKRSQPPFEHLKQEHCEYWYDDDDDVDAMQNAELTIAFACISNSVAAWACAQASHAAAKRRVLVWCLQLMRGLNYLHFVDELHLDLERGNIPVFAFGPSTVLSNYDGDDTTTPPGVEHFILRYVSPEGPVHHSASRESDDHLFRSGCALLELITSQEQPGLVALYDQYFDVFPLPYSHQNRVLVAQLSKCDAATHLTIEEAKEVIEGAVGAVRLILPKQVSSHPFARSWQEAIVISAPLEVVAAVLAAYRAPPDDREMEFYPASLCRQFPNAAFKETFDITLSNKRAILLYTAQSSVYKIINAALSDNNKNSVSLANAAPTIKRLFHGLGCWLLPAVTPALKDAFENYNAHCAQGTTIKISSFTADLSQIERFTTASIGVHLAPLIIIRYDNITAFDVSDFAHDFHDKVMSLPPSYFTVAQPPYKVQQCNFVHLAFHAGRCHEDVVVPGDSEHMKAHFDNGTSITTLLQLGANRSAANDAETTPLFKAAQYGHAAAIQASWEFGAADACTTSGVTPLLAAVIDSQADAFDAFVAGKADVRETGTSSRAALLNHSTSPSTFSPTSDAARAVGHVEAINTLVEAIDNLISLDARIERILLNANSLFSRVLLLTSPPGAGKSLLVDKRLGGNNKSLGMCSRFDCRLAEEAPLTILLGDVLSTTDEFHLVSDSNMRQESGRWIQNMKVVVLANRADDDTLDKMAGPRPSTANFPLDDVVVFVDEWNTCKEIRIVRDLAGDVDINACQNDGASVLHVAAFHGSVGVISLAAALGADVMLRDLLGQTPLHVAAFHGHVEVIEQLILLGCSVDAVTHRGMTALHCAVSGGNADAVKCLVKRGAELKAQTKERATTYLLAAATGRMDVLFALAEADFMVSPNAIDACAHTRKQVRIAALNGQTPLYVAASHGHSDMISALCMLGANVSACANNGWSPLHAAAHGGHVGAIHALFESDAEACLCLLKMTIRADLHVPRARDAELLNLLDLLSSCCSGDVGHRQALRDVKCHLTALSPICIAAYCGHVAAVEALAAKCGCLETHEVIFSLLVTVIHGHIEVVQSLASLVNNAAWFSAPLLAAVVLDHVDCINVLISFGPSTSQEFFSQRTTALHAAASYGNAGSICALLDAGASVNAKNINGLTPLHVASSQGHLMAVKALLRNIYPGAIADETNDGATPLYLASGGNLDVVVELLVADIFDLMGANGTEMQKVESHASFADCCDPLCWPCLAASTEFRSKLQAIAEFIVKALQQQLFNHVTHEWSAATQTPQIQECRRGSLIILFHNLFNSFYPKDGAGSRAPLLTIGADVWDPAAASFTCAFESRLEKVPFLYAETVTNNDPATDEYAIHQLQFGIKDAHGIDALLEGTIGTIGQI